MKNLGVAPEWKSPAFKSFAIHFGIILSVVLIPRLFSLSTIDENNVQFIKSSVRIDIVSMPTQTLKNLKLVDLNRGSPKKVKASKAASKSSASAEFEIKSKKRPRTKFKKIPRKKSAKGSKSSETDDAIDKLLLAGNKLSKGSSATGDVVSGDRGAFEEYAASMPAHVRPYWKLPSFLRGKDLKCRIQIYIGENGKVLKTSYYEKSGDDDFDQRALNAIKASAPFPIPPKEAVAFLQSGAIVLGFPL
jgi:colicin import membrane protein